jgi:outer membrane cobalamin receptor
MGEAIRLICACVGAANVEQSDFPPDRPWRFRLRFCVAPIPLAVLTGLFGLIAIAAVGADSEQNRPPGQGETRSSGSSSESSSAFDTAEEMIVSATRTPRTRGSIPSFTTVLDGDDLAVSVSTSLADELRFVTGLQVTQAGGRGGVSTLSLRGLDPNHVVVLIDGVRLNDPTNSQGGSFDPTTLTLVNIDRVEVIPGPLSSVYGSDALAGVINIITRKAGPNDDPKASVSARGGRFHEGSVVAQASGGLAGVAGLSIGAGIDTFRDPNSDGGYDGASIKAKLNATLPFEIDFEGFTRIHESSSRAYPESSGGSELATLPAMQDRNVREILFGLSLDRDLGDFNRTTIRLSRTSRREDLDSPGIVPALPFDPFTDVPPSSAGDEYKRWDLALTTDWDVPAFDVSGTSLDTRVVAGVDFLWEDGESDAYLDFGGGPTPFPFYDDRRTIGIYGEIAEAIGKFVVLSAGLRFDTTPDEKDRLAPSAGVTVDIPQTTLTLFGSYGEGFKRPSFYALGNPLVGNPNLLVEKSRGWEIGVRARALDDRLRGQISYFDIKVNDIIVFDAAAFILRNEPRLISRGVQLELDWEPRDWLDLRGGITYNPTDFENTSLSPENRSRWRGFAHLNVRPLDQIEMSLRVLAVSSSKASSFQTGNRVITLAGYERVDVRVTYQPQKWLEAFVEIQNLTNQTHREAVGFESPGIAPRLGLTIRH